MSAIKPPTGPSSAGAPMAPEDVLGADHAAGSKTPDGVQGATSPHATGPVDPMQAVVADLRAGSIAPDQAVSRMTDIALERSGAPSSVRGAVEAQVRAMLARDPLVRDLLRQMGATIPSDK